MSLKLISFDFWGTLYHNNPSLAEKQKTVIQQIIKSASGNAILRAEVSNSVDSAWAKWDVFWKEEYRTLTVHEWLEIVLDDLQVELSEDYFNTCCRELQALLFTGNTKEIPGVRTALEKLNNHYKLSIISDTGNESGEYLRKLLQNDKLDYFGYSVFSNEFGRSKPHGSLFESLLAHYQLEPGEAVHIGDLRRTDVEGAKSVGMHTIRFSGCKNDMNSTYSEADYIINDYALLPGVLEKINQID